MGQISNEYIDAILEGKISLIMQLATYFGTYTASGCKKWKSDGLVVVVDDMNWAMIATYNKRKVAATNRHELFFIGGDWWEIIKTMQERIREATRAAELERIRGTITEIMMGRFN